MFNPANPNQQYGVGFNPSQPTAPQYPQVLTGEEYAMLSKKLNDNLLSLKIDERDAAVAICPHRDSQNRSTLYVGEDGKHHCSLCGAAFEFRSYSDAECKKITQDLIDLLQVCKTATMDHPVDFFRNFYVMIPLLQKIPALYQNISSAVNNYWNSQNSYNTMSPINPNPDAFFMANNALYGNWQQPMNQGQYYQPTTAQGQFMGQQGYQQPAFNPNVQPGYNNPMAYGNPATTPAANPTPAAPAPGAMPAPSATPADAGATGGEVVQTKTMYV